MCGEQLAGGARAAAANGLQLRLERFYFRKGRLLVIMDVNLKMQLSTVHTRLK